MTDFQRPGPLGQQIYPFFGFDGTLTPRMSPIPGYLGSSNEWSTFLSTGAAQYDAAGAKTEKLFTQCLSPRLGIAEQDFVAAAAQLGVDVEAVKAISQVETKGAAFDAFGRPTILFERHYFHKLTSGKFSAAHPGISNKKSGGYGKFSVQYDKLQQAYRLNRSAAFRSASWGRFQIMGSNYQAAGYATVTQFVAAMMDSEANHLVAFVKFIEANAGLLKALQAKNWPLVAALYNGPGYAKNNYDQQMKTAYEKLVAQRAKKLA